MTSASVRDHATAAALLLAENGYALDSNVHKISNIRTHEVRVSWASGEADSSFYDFEEGSLTEYLHALRTRQFSLVLNDGALIQISYDFNSEQIQRHRLAFIPCPIRFELDDVRDLTVDDFIGICNEEELRTRMCTRPYLRFDFDRDASPDPFSHMHTAFAKSRIPLSGPLSVGQFLEFVFSHFYPTILTATDVLRCGPMEFMQPMITDEHKQQMHLAWHRSESARRRSA